MNVKYRCPKCGHIYDLLPNSPLPVDDSQHYASHTGVIEGNKYYCHRCLYSFLDDVYKEFKLEMVK